jgi:hypothetical protein
MESTLKENDFRPIVRCTPSAVSVDTTLITWFYIPGMGQKPNFLHRKKAHAKLFVLLTCWLYRYSCIEASITVLKRCTWSCIKSIVWETISRAFSKCIYVYTRYVSWGIFENNKWEIICLFWDVEEPCILRVLQSRELSFPIQIQIRIDVCGDDQDKWKSLGVSESMRGTK